MITLNNANIDFDNWLRFIFDHHVNLEAPWYLLDEIELETDTKTTVEYLTLLFQRPMVLVEDYTMPQIDQGFWFIPSSSGLTGVFVNDKLPLNLRKKCISSIKTLFAELYDKYSVGTSGLMWWESVFLYSVWENKDISSDFEILDCIGEVLLAMLNSGDTSKKSSLHGLKHLDLLLVELLNTNDHRTTEINNLRTKIKIQL